MRFTVSLFSQPRGPARRAPASAGPAGDREPAFADPRRPSALGRRYRTRRGPARKERCRDRPAAATTREAHAPAVVALDEAARAVDRVDDEDRLALAARRIVGRLLRQPAIVRPLGQKARAKKVRRPPCPPRSPASRRPWTRRSDCGGRSVRASAPASAPPASGAEDPPAAIARLKLRFPSCSDSAFDYPDLSRTIFTTLFKQFTTGLG